MGERKGLDVVGKWKGVDVERGRCGKWKGVDVKKKEGKE